MTFNKGGGGGRRCLWGGIDAAMQTMPSTIITYDVNKICNLKKPLEYVHPMRFVTNTFNFWIDFYWYLFF